MVQITRTEPEPAASQWKVGRKQQHQSLSFSDASTDVLRTNVNKRAAAAEGSLNPEFCRFWSNKVDPNRTH